MLLHTNAGTNVNPCNKKGSHVIKSDLQISQIIWFIRSTVARAKLKIIQTV